MDTNLALKLLVLEAKRWIGVTELGGANKGQLVELFQKASDGKAQGESWCAAFVQFCITHIDKVCTVIDPKHVSTSLVKTEHCLTLWNKAPASLKTYAPRPGCLVVWQHWKDGKPTASGHIGIVTSVGKDTMTTIEGNTSGSAEIDREGDGVFEKTRSVKGSGTMKVVGFITPWEIKNEKIA